MNDMKYLKKDQMGLAMLGKNTFSGYNFNKELNDKNQM